MKKVLTLFGLVLSVLSADAQKAKTYSTTHKMMCHYNIATSAFDKCEEAVVVTSTFTISPDEKSITYTAPEGQQSYSVKHKIPDPNSVTTYQVMADDGNKYTFMIDMKNMAVEIMGSGNPNKADDFLLYFPMKK
jgi:hypothetical protein